MEEIKHLFETPLPEDKILAGTPLRWKVGETEFKTDLLTPHKWDVFAKLSNGIRLKEANKSQTFSMTLTEWFDALDKINEKRKDSEKVTHIEEGTKSFLSDSLKDFRDIYGCIPQNITQLIMAVSDLDDINTAHKQISEYYNGIGLIPPSIYDFKNHKLQKAVMANYLSMTANIDGILILLDAIQQCNVEVKKKHGKPASQIGSTPKHSKGKSPISFRQQMHLNYLAEKRLSLKSSK